MMLLSLKASEAQGRVTRAPGTPREHAVIELAQMWGEVADCVYHQNTFRLCDIDNRALAVEAGSIFIRQTDKIAAQPRRLTPPSPAKSRPCNRFAAAYSRPCKARCRAAF